tara:strand:+ start:430 stop:2439 length:2010 start_codon:yes stop_codon:yes gene_type:complete
MGQNFIKPLTFSLISFAFFAQAQEELIIKSSRLVKDKIVGAQTYIVDKEFIQSNPSKSIPELLAKLPGIKIKDLRGGGLGASQSIDIRGFGDTATSNTLILLNGQRLTNIDLSLVDFTTIPRDSIDRIEVIMGNSSVLFGNNATAGSINIITDQSIKKGDQLNASFIVGSLGKFGSYLSGVKTKDKFSVKGNHNTIFSDGYRRNSSLYQNNGSIEVAYNNKYYDFYINLKSNNQFQELPGDVGVNTGNFSNSNGFNIDPRSSDTPDDFSQNNGHQFFYGTSYDFDKSNTIVIDGSYKYNKSEGKFLSSSSDTDTRISTYQISPRLLSDQKIFGFNSDSIFGVDLNYAYYYSDRMSTGKAWYKKYKASDLNFAPYFNSNLSLSDKDDVSLGFRYQWNWLRAGDMNNPTAYAWTLGDQETIIKPDHQYAFHLGYERLINENNTISVKGGRSFRYPNIDERVGSGFVSATHNFKLASQKSVDIEFGYKFFSKDLKISTNFYYMRMLSEIKYDNATFTNRNLARTHRYGMENKIDYKFNNHFLFSNSFSIAQSKYRGGQRRDNDLTGVPAFKNVFDFEYKISKYFNPTISLYYQSSQRMINDEENYQVVQPGYHLIDIGFNGSLYNFDYSMMFNNVLNRNYYQYAVASTNNYNVYNTYPLEGFNMMFTIKKSF